MPIPLFLIPILSALVAQGLKPLLNRDWRKRLHDEGLAIPRYGGMPSAHTSFAISLATVIGLVDGLGSTSFVIAAAVVIFILDDALRMRIFLGRYGTVLSTLLQRIPESEREDLPYLEKQLGHTVPEVIAGGIVGLVVSLALLWLL